MAVDLTLAKQHVRVDGGDEDATITLYLAAAKAWVESYTGKLLSRREVVQEEACFGRAITLLYGPSPEDIAITYDNDGTEATITDARLVRDRLYPAVSWPIPAADSAISVSYTAGFTEVPGELDAAVLLMTGDFYANREAGTASPATTAAVEALCDPYRAVLV